jgi:hypothetical protein
MTTIKRQGYPDIIDEDLNPLGEITPINQARSEWKGPKPVVLPDLIIIAHIPEVRECTKTVILGDADD